MICDREYIVDNIKMLLLFTVAFAHNLIPFKEESKIIEFIVKFIYLFHMPLFAFCTGYLVDKSKRNIWNYIKKLLVPYIVFQLLYIVIGTTMIRLGIISYSANTMGASIVEPSSPLYFLICMIFWRLLYPIFECLKTKRSIVIILLSVVAVLLSLDYASNTMLLPCFSLLPFYYAGCAMGKKVFEKTQNILTVSPLYLCIAVGGYLFLTLIVPYNIILFRINVWNIDETIIMTLFQKLLYYIIAFLGILIVIGVIPRKKIGRITQKASNGMVIYIGSSFLSPYLYIALCHMCPFLDNFLLLNLIGIFIFTITTIWLLSLDCWTQLYNFIFERSI